MSRQQQYTVLQHCVSCGHGIPAHNSQAKPGGLQKQSYVYTGKEQANKQCMLTVFQAQQDPPILN